MRSTTAAWAAAMAVMSMHGPLTIAEAAPAQNEGGSHRYLLPRQARRDRVAREPALTETSINDDGITGTSLDPTNALGMPVSLPLNPLSLISSVLSKAIPPFTGLTQTETPAETTPTAIPSTETSGNVRVSSKSESSSSEVAPLTTTAPISTQQISSRSDSYSPSGGFLGSILSGLLNPTKQTSDSDLYPPSSTTTEEPNTSSDAQKTSLSSTSSTRTSSDIVETETGRATTTTESAKETTRESTSTSSYVVGLTTVLQPSAVSPSSASKPSSSSESKSSETMTTSVPEASSTTATDGPGLLSPLVSIVTGLIGGVPSPSHSTAVPTDVSQTSVNNQSGAIGTPDGSQPTSLSGTTTSSLLPSTTVASTNSPGVIVSLLSGLLNPSTQSVTVPGATNGSTDTVSSSPTSSSSENPLIIVPTILDPHTTPSITTDVASSPSSTVVTDVASSPSPTSSSEPIIISILSGILGHSSNSTSEAIPTTMPPGIFPTSGPTGTSNNFGGTGVVSVGSSVTPAATGSSPLPTSTSAILSSIVSEISGIASPATSSLVGGPTSTPATTTPSAPTSTMILSGSSTMLWTLSTSGSVVVPIPLTTTTAQLPSANGTVPIPSNVTAPITSTGILSGSASLPTINATSGTSTTNGNGTAPITSLSSATQTSSSPTNNTITGVVPTSASTSGLTSTAADSSGSTVTPSHTTATVPETSTSQDSSSTSATPDTTVTATSFTALATNNLTQMSIPTSSLIFETSSSSTVSSSKPTLNPTSTPASSIPTGIPHLIQAPGGMQKEPPENTTMIQVAFSYGLNYQFVLTNADSRGQIFIFLPQGIAYALGISPDNVTMQALTPFDTKDNLGYVTTLAQAFIPSNMVTQLQLDLMAPNSLAYSNQKPVIRTLMSLINPTISILPGANLDPGAPSAVEEQSGASTSQSAGGAPLGGDSSGSSTVNGSTVGVGVGAVAGAAVFSVAMMYVARRYRRRKQLHRRINSINGMPEMMQTSYGGAGAYWMSGANGRRTPLTSGRGSRNSAGSNNNRSVREQGISGPVMSENSLGWN